MKHIQRNMITAISADYEDGNFPVENLLDDKPGRIWSAGGLVINATLTLAISGGVSDVAIFGTNARNCTFTAYDPNEAEWAAGIAWATGIEWGNVTIGAVTGTVIKRNRSNAMWIYLDNPLTRSCFMELNLTSTGDQTLYAGVCTAAIAETYGGANFRYGAGESRIDHSITAENSNGSRYYKKRGICRQMSLTALMLREESDKLLAAFDDNGAIQSAWKMFSETGTAEDLIYGWSSISRSYDHLNHDTVQITITEAL